MTQTVNPQAPTTSASASSTWTLDPSHSSIHFSGRHLVISTVRGRFSRFEATVRGSEAEPEASSVEIRVDAASVDTGLEQRDQHLKSPDFLDVEHYPTILFRSTAIERTTDDRLGVRGELTIRDVTLPVELEATSHGLATGMSGARRAAFSAELTLDRRDWGITWNMPLGGDTVLVGTHITLQFELTLEESTDSESAAPAA